MITKEEAQGDVPIVGRAHELKIAHGAVRNYIEGKRKWGVIIIEGDKGTGKSHIMSSVETYAKKVRNFCMILLFL